MAGSMVDLHSILYIGLVERQTKAINSHLNEGHVIEGQMTSIGACGHALYVKLTFSSFGFCAEKVGGLFIVFRAKITCV